MHRVGADSAHADFYGLSAPLGERGGFKWRCLTSLMMLFGASIPSAGAADVQQVNGAGLRIERSRATGLATFVTSADGGGIPVPATGANALVGPMDFLRAYGGLFGVVDADVELVETRASRDDLAHTHTSYRQVRQGVPIFGGVLRVHQNDAGDVFAANGHFFPIPNTLSTTPGLTADDAVAAARARIGVGNPVQEMADLLIVDPGWYGDPPAGTHLAYHIILTDLAAGVREAFFVDAHTGKILDQWNLLHTARNRVVRNGSLSGSPIVRVEGGPATGDFDADAAYDYAGDTYDYLFRAFGRDSLDNVGITLSATAHWHDVDCPNARYIGGGRTEYCDGIVTDDIVAHEFGHGLTGFTADLIYQNQPGQLNESFSDVLGEIVDLLNGDAAFPGAPGGTPWPTPADYTGPGTDTPNDLRTACVASAYMTVNSPANIAGNYAAQPAFFGPALTTSGTSGNVAVADPVRACLADLPFRNAGELAGKVVLVDRGDCTFTEKVKNAQDAGAIAVMVANNVAAGLPPMGGSDPGITIRSVGIGQTDGAMIKSSVPSGVVNVTLRKNESPDVRWLVSEDSSGFGGAIRDMWMPSCMGDPDTANHPFQTCYAEDNGGVHSGSGVPNHAFAIATDGQSFNGQTVAGIGLFKAAAVWYRALTVYLTSTSDFGDAYTAMNQSAVDLTGETIRDPRDGSNFGVFTAADAVEVDKALLAVEMNTRGLCGANEVLDPTPPEECSPQIAIYSDNFQSGVNGWTVSNTGPFGPPTPYNWVQKSGGLPLGRPGTVWFGADRNIGNCATVDESAVHSLFSPLIALPASVDSPTLQFTHYVETEAGYDGGNVKISVNGGAWQVLPAAAFSYNRYNTTLLAAPDNTNPLAGQPAWSGGTPATNNWGTSLIDLGSFVTGGETIRFRFDFGKDGCAGVTGWFLDDFRLYDCTNPLISIIPDPAGYKTRNVAFSVRPPANATGTGNEMAIEITMVDLQHPIPANLPANPPPNFSGYESGSCAPRTCVGGPKNGAICVLPAPVPTDCPSPGVCTAAVEDNGCARWVGKPGTFLEAQDIPLGASYRAARLQCTPFYWDWVTETVGGPIAVVGAEIAPSSEYSVQSYGASCKGLETGCTNVSLAVTMFTRRSGDVEAPFNPPSTSAQPDVTDIAQVVAKVKNLPGALVKSISQLQPNLVELNADVSALDLVDVVDRAKGFAYAFSGPCPCPSTVTCGPAVGSVACTTPTVCVTAFGAGAMCVKTCTGGDNIGDPCINNTHCPGSTCGAGFCRDRCGRCKP